MKNDIFGDAFDAKKVEIFLMFPTFQALDISALFRLRGEVELQKFSHFASCVGWQIL